ncbi:MAG TPA: potassium transporter TrkG, partial [Gemmataceae bacterium]
MPLPRPPSVHPWDVPLGTRPSLWKQLRPAQLFVGSFGLLVLLGTLGLKFLPGLYAGPELGWLDALFTSASAVCVTGLIVVDTATYFTPRGQAFLLVLIQLGGLGMITFTSLILVALGRRLSLRQEALAGAGEVGPRVTPRQLVRDVARFTLALEAAGAALLYLLWAPRFGWGQAAWPAVFHSVSAFCNAGFSTFSDSLIPFRESPLSLTVIMLLIVAGGIGFLPMEELYLWHRARRRGNSFRLSLHTQIVLATTTALLAGGWLLFALGEWGRTLRGLGFGHKLVNALFMSVTCRTAGFNTIDYARADEDTQFLTVLLMMIGGSPGSTAGGIKTTTFALLGILAWSKLRGDEVATVRGRSLREETTDRAVGVFVIAFGVVTAGIFLLTKTEGATGWGGFLDRMFEAVSAFGTVGLSTGQ